MTDDLLLSMSRRRLLAGLGTAAAGGVTASAVGKAVRARAQESKGGAVVPSILAFDVNESLLDIQHLAPLFERLFGDGKFVNEWYAQLVLYSEAITLAGAIHTILQFVTGCAEIDGLNPQRLDSAGRYR